MCVARSDVWASVRQKYVKEDASDESESTEEEEDEQGEDLDDPEWDNQFFRILPMIQAKVPTIYENKEFFPEKKEGEGEDEEEAAEKKKKKKQKEKPLLLKDYMRQQLIETEGKGVDSDEEMERAAADKEEEDLPPALAQARAKEEFLRSVQAAEAGEGDELFAKKKKSKKEQQKEEEDFQAFMQEQSKKKVPLLAGS